MIFPKSSRSCWRSISATISSRSRHCSTLRSSSRQTSGAWYSAATHSETTSSRPRSRRASPCQTSTAWREARFSVQSCRIVSSLLIRHRLVHGPDASPEFADTEDRAAECARCLGLGHPPLDRATVGDAHLASGNGQHGGQPSLLGPLPPGSEGARFWINELLVAALGIDQHLGRLSAARLGRSPVEPSSLAAVLDQVLAIRRAAGARP